VKIDILKHWCLFFFLMPALSSFADPAAGDTSTKAYPVTGVVEKIAPDRHTTTIHNQDIPGYMDEMTMDFAVQNTNELNGITPGDEIAFTLIVSKNDSWIKNVHRTGKTMPVSTSFMPTMPEEELKIGDLLPDGVLTAEDGREIHFSDFRGQALAFTFFYTRCPLPNYCPLMNRNFAAARDLISSAAGAPTNWVFLSISFDPHSDTPEVLATFGGFYRHGNPSHWFFASAPKNTLATLAPALDLMVIPQGDTISHNLRTVVLNPQGRIYRLFDGNQWTPEELAKAILTAARP
jgi:protein SCO1/2